MPEITTSFEVYCGSCGAGLCGNSRNASTRRGEAIEVEPCETCLEKARDEGYENGYNQAYKDYNKEH